MAFGNKRVQRLRRLVHRRSERQAERLFVAEGAKLVRAGLDQSVRIEAVFFAPTARGDPAVSEVIDRTRSEGIEVFELAEGVLERVSDVRTPQPVMAVFGYLDNPLEVLQGSTLVLVCCGVSDPGNAGTVLRSAEAAGADGVVLCRGAVDIYNPKTVRASAGALFRTSVVTDVEACEALTWLKFSGFRRLGTSVRTATPYTDVDLVSLVALVLGNEAAGIERTLEPCLDGSITIPMSGAAESLNVGMAASVICFEAARQRRLPQPLQQPARQTP